jgi:amino acid transporter/nucleotide-binding universal stress UspA family protein
MPSEKKTSEKVTFARDLTTFDATMIGVGALIGAGIFVLTGMAAGIAGPASILAFALNGVVTLFTALSYAELASAVPEAGGGYSFVKKAFPEPVAFTAGWMDWFARIIACSLYALGFSAYFLEFTNIYIHPFYSLVVGNLGPQVSLSLMTLVVGAIFIALNYKGASASAKTENIITLAKIFVLAIFVLFGLKEIFHFPGEAMANFKPFLPKGFGGVITAMGLTFIAFEGYDIITTVSEEIKDPQKNIPKAIFRALGIVIPLYLLILFVSLGSLRPEGMSSWQFLGKYKEIAIIKAAEEFIPYMGVALIGFGAILSTMSALNATLWASSRVSFAMARDKLLPEKLSTIHAKRRTPHISVVVSGAIFLFMAVFLPIEVVGSGASLMFLLTFSLVNLSVIALRRKRPDIKRGFKIPFYPVPPILGVFCCLFLAVFQYKFKPLTWYIGLIWIFVGLLVYFAYFEKKTAGQKPQVLDADKREKEFEEEKEKKKFRILVPLHNPDHVTRLLDFAIPLAQKNNGEIVVLVVVDVPIQLPIHEGLRFVHHKRPLLKIASDYAREKGIEIESDIRVAHRIADGIISSAAEENASLLLMGWKGYTNTRDKIFGEVTDHVIRLTPCDLIVLKLAKFPIQRILLPSAGGANARLAAKLAQTLMKTLKAEITCCNVVPKDPSDDDRQKGREWIEKTLKDLEFGSEFNKKLVESNSVPAGLIREAKDYDLVVIGATNEGYFKRIFLGEIPEKIARHSDASVMVVKRYEGKVKSWIKKLFG